MIERLQLALLSEQLEVADIVVATEGLAASGILLNVNVVTKFPVIYSM